MKACANSMGSLHVKSAAPCCPPGPPQLKSGRGSNVRERHGNVDSVSVTLRGACQSNYADSKVNLVKTYSFIKTDTSSRSQNSSNKQNGRNGENSTSLKGRKPGLELQPRVQDALNNGTQTAVREVDDGGRRSRDRPRRQPTGERRRRVQVVGNNGLVDLETQLGLVSDDEVSREIDDIKVSQGRAPREEVERTLLESSLQGIGSSEIQRRQSSSAEVCSDSEIPSQGGPSFQSARSDSYSGSRSESMAASLTNEVFDVEVADQVPRVSFASEPNGQDDWVRNGPRGPPSLAELPGGRRVVELVAAWDGLAGRLPPELVRSSDSDLLLRALKLSVMALQSATPTADVDGRTPLCRALAVAHTLADLGMDAEVISTGLLREVVDAGLISYSVIEKTLGGSIPRLLHDCSRVRHIPSRVETLDDENSKALRQFCLAFHDIRSVVVELASRLDTMRHIHAYPRYRQQILALETMQIYAPLAHAIGTGSMSLELEDLGFRVLFPDSYSFIENWLRSHWVDGSGVVDECRDQLSAALQGDEELQELVENITITGRYKSRFSTMRKLLKDGRKPEEVFDVLGLRVILEPKAGSNSDEERERGIRSCYRAMEVATHIWKEVPGRLKDYIAEPKQNGYESLHLAVHLSDQNEWRPPMEIQIRTVEMDTNAVAGQASHSLYKGGLTDPEQVRNLKMIMVAAANVAATRFGEIARNAVSLEGADPILSENDQIFKMFDKNQDGVISVDEFRDVIHELGADKEDALELMRIVDLNTDGSVSAEEFGKFRHQIQIAQNLAGVDREVSSQLGTKLPQITDTSSEMLCLGSGNCGDFEVELDTCGSGKSADIEVSNQLHAESSSEGSHDMDGEVVPSNMLDTSDAIPSSDEAELITSIQVNPSTNTSDPNRDSLPARSGKQKPSLVKPLRLPEKPLAPTPTTNSRKDLDSWSETQESISLWPSSVKNADLEGLKVPAQIDESSDKRVEEDLSTFRRFLASGDKASARKIIMTLSKKYPENIKVILHRASLERKCGDMVAAGGLYSQAIRKFKLKGDLGIDYVRALQAWGTLEAHVQNPERARYLFMESLNASQKGEVESSLRATGVYGLHGWAMLEERTGNWSKARALLQRAADLEPGNAVVHQSRARLEARAHNYAAARSHFKLSVEANPEDAKCWHAWAMFEASQKKWRKMRQLFGRALEVDPESTYTLQAWAHQEGLVGTVESKLRARNLYKKCAEINPNNVHCWQSWAILEQESGNFAEARILFERGLGANPESVLCLQAYAHMERKCGNLESAQRLLLVALAIEPENAASLMELAVVEDTLGNFEVAQELYQQAAILDKKKSRVKRRTFESRKKEFQVERASRKKSPASLRPDVADRAWRSEPESGDMEKEKKTAVAVRSKEIGSESRLRIPFVAVSSQIDR
ncbi:hypothetical protein MPTK1_1g27830 [Marchantia polymorpha subsp. ruderalis]|uniref:GTP diphosphokinase n=2 Tax=Marchantia polymorpha TaxID=3197 RepID=A0AAF6AV12_MARPO|nr:hypothetical protein MARPO_0002s0095 [Marchantia polymorpha]BBN00283.1 hypothetical protein Mp_1g27830 [Marchantia polymorpha subsp. ruderalis]|eukprot:PTQ49600.1 hypothetical protein MARPO_0002s0095 [Marchantia polymorpha]